ncbi:MAG: Fur family transcriptional regulator [Anaerolineae bacterium]|nr:transcriptional repressor [Anaerolineae bacterium]MDW8068205.1 Fur family transcriptional regulator [Anaerolineae bacterium]
MIPYKELLSQNQLSALIRRLRERGYRFTPQRMAIVRAVLESTGHPSAEEIYREVSATFPMLSLATVYKTLEMLRDLGEVMELPVGGRTRYDRNPQPHVHLICEKCHTVMDWEEEVAVPVSTERVAATGFHPHHYRVEIYGLCSRCRTGHEGHTDNGPGT